MLNDLAWRKVPRNIIRDEDLDYISSLMPERLTAAPMLLYFIMYCKADDDGVVDLEDGVIYSRLTHIATPREVLDIAALMTRRKLLIPVMDGTNVYLIDDWDIPMRPGTKPARTMEERRANVAAKIRAEQEQKKTEQQKIVDFDELRSASGSFFCPDVDKNRENVDMQRVEREKRVLEIQKTQENLDFEIKRDKTHTQGSDGGILQPPYAAKENLQEMQTKTETEKQQTGTDQEIKNLVDLAMPSGVAVCSNGAEKVVEKNESKARSSDINAVFVVFSNFFAKYCLGFQAEQHRKELLELSALITQLEDERNPAPVIASVFCQQFKTLTESEGYFKNLPLYPRELLNSKVYRTVLSMASRILCSKSANDNWIQQNKALKEIPEDRAVYDDLKPLLVQCGIDPEGEHPLTDFILKKVTAIK